MNFYQEIKKAEFEATHAPLESRSKKFKIGCPGFFSESHVIITDHSIFYVGVDGDIDVDQNPEYARLLKTFASEHTIPGAGSQVFIPGAFAGNLTIVNQKKVCVVQ